MNQIDPIELCIDGRRVFGWVLAILSAVLCHTRTSEADDVGLPSRQLDAFADPGRWVTAELTARPATDTLADGRPTLHVHIDVDHKQPANSPVGWPRMYLQLDAEEKGWQEYESFEFLLLGRTDRPKESGIYSVLNIMCPDKKTGAGVSIILPKPNVWTKVSIPISSISSLNRLGALNFYIGEKRYEHGEQVDFFLGAFRLKGRGGRPAADGVQITTLDTYVLDDFESVVGWNVLKDSRVEAVDSAAVGKGAMRLDFPGSVRKELRARPLKDLLVWEKSEGVSFWAKGDGSDEFGCLSLQGWGGRLSYVYYFPLKDDKWRKFTVPWQDFVPQGQYEPINAPGGLSPGGGFHSITLGDRWAISHNNQPIPRFKYGIDHLKIEERVEQPGSISQLCPLEDVRRQLRASKPVRIVCLGDSIAAGAALPDPDKQRYAAVLQRRLRARLQYDEVHVKGCGVGGARTTDARAWVNRDLDGPPPDLVIVQYGYNDKKLYSREFFQRSLDDLIDRIARKTEGQTAVLLTTTLPGTGAAFSLLDDFADAVGELGEAREVAVLDLHRTMKDAGTRAEIESTYFADMAHPNEAGHRLIAGAIADFLHESETAIRIDFGTPESPVRNGFVRVTGDASEDDRVSWSDAASLQSFDRPIPRGPSQPVIYTTDWRQDGVQGTGPATLRIDVPPGSYHVWAIGGPTMEDSPQVWNMELNSGNASTQATWSDGYSCRRLVLDVAHEDAGPLELNINTQSRWALNALVIASHEEWAETIGEQVAALEQEAFVLPPDVLSEWKHKPPIARTQPTEFSDADRARGFVIHQRSWVTPVWPDSPPNDNNADIQLKTFASPGEYEPLTFTLLPLGDLSRVMINVSDLRSDNGHVISSDDIDVRYVQYKWVRPNYNVRGTYYRAPDLLPDYTESRDLTAGDNFRVWMTVHVRPDVAPGQYKGLARVNVAGEDVAELPLHVRVLPIKLETDPHFVNGTYYKAPVNQIDKAPDAFSRDWWSGKLRHDLTSMGQHGYNAFIASIAAGPADSGGWRTSIDEVRELLELARSNGLGMTEPIVGYFNYALRKRYRHYTGRDLNTHLVDVRMPPQEFFDEVTGMVRAFEAERKRLGLGELLYYPIDEPAATPASVDFTTAVLKAVKQVSGVRTYLTADPTKVAFEPIKPYVDVWCCHYFALTEEERAKDARERGVEHWCYPNRVAGENDHTPVAAARMTYGFGRWRLGYSVLTPWTFQADSGAPENYLDGYVMDFFNQTDDDGSVLPCTLYEAYREGIDDGRYIATLQHWIKRARQRGFDREAEEAEQRLTSIRNSISPNQKDYGQMRSWGWTGERLDEKRWELAQAILTLQNL